MGVYALLRERFPRLILKDISLKRNTTIGCGGNALAAYPLDGGELCYLVRILDGNHIPYYYMGVGANLLPPDEPPEGVVIRFTRMKTLNLNGSYLYAGAGVTGGSLCRFARENGLGGFEPFTGIPMSVGGGCCMNAGVRGGHFSDVVRSVVAVEKGKLRLFSQKMCAFGEKQSVFQEGIAVVGVLFRGQPRGREEIDFLTRDYRARRAHLPKGRSMGCTFVNPQGCSAGELIEGCGLKGASVGGARVSELHGNFIINEGGTSHDVATLIAYVKGEVEKKTGVRLREEIRYLTRVT